MEVESDLPIPQRPTANDRSTWLAYWMAQGMPWRTEPEVDQDRQRYLAKRRAVEPDIENGVYPFRDESGGIKLTRADIEWLLATHNGGHWLLDSKGTTVGVGGNLHIRQGLDLRGAVLQCADLRRLPLAQLRGGLGQDDWFVGTSEQREAAAIHLEAADLRNCDLELAALRSAHLEGADLRNANLSGATLRDAHLNGALLPLDMVPAAGVPAPKSKMVSPADMRRAYFSLGTTLDGAHLGDNRFGHVRLADLRWGGANAATINWADVSMIGDEEEARRRTVGRHRKDGTTRLREFEEAARANVQVAVLLRDLGMAGEADRFGYRALLCQRQALRRQGRVLSALGSWFLDLVAGYGYRPIRSFLTYVLVVLGFAAAYLALGGANSKPLSWNEAIVVSMTAFHGRGFFAAVFQPGDLQAAVAALEAFVGLLIEIVFIATFTQRFFAR